MASQMTSRYTWVSQKFSQDGGARQIDSARGDQSALWSLVGSRVPSESLSLTRAARRRQRLEDVLEESAEAQAAEAAEAEGGSSSSRSAAGTDRLGERPARRREGLSRGAGPSARGAGGPLREHEDSKATIWKGHTTDGVPARRSFHEVQRRPSPAGEAAQGPLRVRTPRVRQARGATGAAEVAERASRRCRRPRA
ncbi:unnamed protein product [Prorocentrum cordatum]|uniref:Uncharacterized protein n=1 Tax=Prorocentrum cordatum TaxID=2364126 RepID=A0ABN9U9W9_9DINO|nr:unnamed protein product [Polarella glacialis]